MPGRNTRATVVALVVAAAVGVGLLLAVEGRYAWAIACVAAVVAYAVAAIGMGAFEGWSEARQRTRGDRRSG